MAVRSALGAGRLRLVRQLLTESVILGFLGGAFGLLLAIWGLDGLLSLKPEGIPRLTDVRIDPTVILFTMALSISTGLLFGVIPAFHATTSSLAATLKEAGRGPLTTRGGSRMRSALVVGEMALAVMLLAGAGLLIRSFVSLPRSIQVSMPRKRSPSSCRCPTSATKTPINRLPSSTSCCRG